ncbi:MAG: hypothetical protein MUP55_00685 [Candidatus Aenigmarchaeota archaeon]|nr:hypothetical protein [Candidatus Aenigmarchaeota archaeon]
MSDFDIDSDDTCQICDGDDFVELCECGCEQMLCTNCRANHEEEGTTTEDDA